MLFLVPSSMSGKAMLNSLRPVSPGRVSDSRQYHSYDYVIQFQEHLNRVFRGLHHVALGGYLMRAWI